MVCGLNEDEVMMCVRSVGRNVVCGGELVSS